MRARRRLALAFICALAFAINGALALRGATTSHSNRADELNHNRPRVHTRIVEPATEAHEIKKITKLTKRDYVPNMEQIQLLFRARYKRMEKKAMAEIKRAKEQNRKPQIDFDWMSVEAPSIEASNYLAWHKYFGRRSIRARKADELVKKEVDRLDRQSWVPDSTFKPKPVDNSRRRRRNRSHVS